MKARVFHWPLALALLLGPGLFPTFPAQARLLPGQQAAPVAPTPALSLPEPPLRVLGSTPVWPLVRADNPAIQNAVLSTEDAFGELYAGRADLVLGTLPPPPPPTGTDRPLHVPVGVFAVSVAYTLPGLDLRLDLPTLCALLSGRISRWNAPAVAALNPGVALPALPVLLSVRRARSGVSLAVAGTCVEAGAWPTTQLKSNWIGGAAFTRVTPGAVRTDLNIPGTLALLALQATPAGVQTARLRSVGGSFVAPRSELGLSAPGPSGAAPTLPTRAFGVLHVSTAAGAYPLRGLVWASLMPQQAYRGRSLERAQALLTLISTLRSRSGRGVAGLPQKTWTPLPLTYQGQPLPAGPAPVSTP
ncbi:hypothetical protein [Deinococcus sp.]|uniref:hypothetical protein n=1 Tax=Deinococcus sp. TaxID=47478 RepID=UPI003C7DE3EA